MNVRLQSDVPQAHAATAPPECIKPLPHHGKRERLRQGSGWGSETSAAM
jgi:hypothetical protein